MTMKKTYIAPSIIWMEAETEEMISASVEKGFNVDDAPVTTETSGNLSRRSVWDDEE